MPEAAATLPTLNACCDIAERILHHGFQQLETSPTTWNALDLAVDILARVTAVRKSLIHLSERTSPKQVGRVSDPTPTPSATDTHSNSPAPESPEDAVARASARDNLPASSSNDSDTPRTSSISAIPETRAIASIPAMPLDRIAPALNRIMTDLAELPCEPCSPDPQPSSPDQGAWERRSPERQSASSPEPSPLDSS
ncbi:hypothetical protein LLG95_06035 [bacterium]|nr:hypothetical protein [bacterium]